MAIDHLSLISYIVRGIQQSGIRIKVFKYLKNNSTKWLYFFLQETHSFVDDGKQWNGDFKWKIFCSHCTKNSCDVAIGFLGSKSLQLVETKNDD